MIRTLWFGTTCAGIAAALVVACGPASSQAKTVAFKRASLIVETNATDGDAGLQISLDHEPWRALSITRPDGKKIIDVANRGTLRDYGLTELFSESSEPPFTTFPFEEFKRLFPAGEYVFEGTTIEGTAMRSLVRLTHDIPAGPVITAPGEGSTVPAQGLVVAWDPVTEPAGIQIKGYQVLVVQEDPVVRTFSADLAAGADSITIPAEFLAAETDYKVEVLAIETNGNQTLSELAFTVA